MPTAKQWERAVERHRRQRLASLACCDDCRAKSVYADPEDEELWALLPGGNEVGRPLVDVLAEEAERNA